MEDLSRRAIGIKFFVDLRLTNTAGKPQENRFAIFCFEKTAARISRFVESLHYLAPSLEPRKAWTWNSKTMNRDFACCRSDFMALHLLSLLRRELLWNH
jgi:hypothetical protein